MIVDTYLQVPGFNNARLECIQENCRISLNYIMNLLVFFAYFQYAVSNNFLLQTIHLNNTVHDKSFQKQRLHIALESMNFGVQVK